MRSGHNRAVDWWSLGALMYDMLTGAVGAQLQLHVFLFVEFVVIGILIQMHA